MHGRRQIAPDLIIWGLAVHQPVMQRRATDTMLSSHTVVPDGRPVGQKGQTGRVCCKNRCVVLRLHQRLALRLCNLLPALLCAAQTPSLLRGQRQQYIAVELARLLLLGLVGTHGIKAGACLGVRQHGGQTGTEIVHARRGNARNRLVIAARCSPQHGLKRGACHSFGCDDHARRSPLR